MKPVERNMKAIPPVLVLMLFFWSLLNPTGQLPAHDQDRQVIARAHLEMGIDSRQQKYLSPYFNYEFPLGFGTVFGEVFFFQRAGDQLRGIIDYWLNLGLKRDFWSGFTAEIRLNHFCRHLSSIENPDILNFNEIMARAWYRNRKIKMGLGIGSYTGGNRDYKSLLVLNGGFNRILGTELSFQAELKFRDFQEVIYEAELNFALNKSTDLFVRNAKYYEIENATFIGIRMKTDGVLADYLDSLKLSTGFYPYNESHKILVEGEFRMSFFETASRRVLFTLSFVAPILRDNGFWGDFYPEKMVYAFGLEYQRKIKENLFLLWTSRYYLNLPLDGDEPFTSDFGTGIGLGNQPDFDLLNQRIRFQVSGGINFDLDYDFNLKAGLSLFPIRGRESQCELHLQANGERVVSSLRFFLDLGKDLSIRPFIRFDQTSFNDSREPSDIRFLFGVCLIRWYNG